MSIRPPIRRLCWIGAACAWAAPSLTARAETVDPIKTAQVKAAYLYNFAKFTTWPNNAFADESAPVVIGILGVDPFGETLDKTVEGKTVENRKFLVKRLPPRSENDRTALRSCHILYISESLQSRWGSILELLGDAPVLVVGESDEFAAAGGMLSFVLSAGNIVFHLNRDAVERSKLQLSSKLMKLAKVVYPKEKS
ncbi:MAG: YfiR family protein [Planctomycetota bacterium]